MTRKQARFDQSLLDEFMADGLRFWCFGKVFGSSVKVLMKPMRQSPPLSRRVRSKWSASAVISLILLVDWSLLLGYSSDGNGPIIKMNRLDVL